MSTQTATYGFIKPELTDPADITALNGNWDKIEETFNSVKQDTTELSNNLQSEVNKLQTKITYGTTEPSGGNPGDVYIQLLDE